MKFLLLGIISFFALRVWAQSDPNGPQPIAPVTAEPEPFGRIYPIKDPNAPKTSAEMKAPVLPKTVAAKSKKATKPARKAEKVVAKKSNKKQLSPKREISGKKDVVKKKKKSKRK